jgi:MFS-type transporter involved in bile tolerance (Atg22 family)
MLERDGYEQFSGGSAKTSSETMTDMKSPSTLGRILRSIGAVFAGLVAVSVLSIGADVLLRTTGIYPPWGQPMSDSQFALATVYRSVFAVAGSFISAQLAPVKPMNHAVALGVLGFIIALVGAVATWNGGPEYGRKWYPISLIVLAIPCGWFGGKLYEKKMRAKN